MLGAIIGLVALLLVLLGVASAFLRADPARLASGMRTLGPILLALVGGSVAMLDHYFDGAAGAAMFKAEHVDEHAMQQAVSDAIGAGTAAMRKAFAAYRSAAEAHLKHEEDIMMPLVARLPLPKAPLFAHWCLTAGIAQGDFEHFVAHGVKSLSGHGSAKNTPAGATRVFVHALKTVCTPAQWADYLPVARGAAPADIWASVIAEVPSLEPAAVPAA